MNILYLSKVEPTERWIPGLSKLLPQDKFFTPDDFDPAAIDVALVARPQEGVTAKLPNVKLIQSLWMGVDGLLADPTFPRDKPLARMIDVGMVAAMTESVVAHVLDYHRHHYVYRAQKQAGKWHLLPQYMTSDRTVGLLGLGELGTAVAERLLQFGFKVGAHIVEKDLVAALDAGRLAHAYLDVFDTEPLPAASPLWAHPAVSITPHTAALTEPRTAMARIVENIERVRAGKPGLNLVDFSAGY